MTTTMTSTSSTHGTALRGAGACCAIGNTVLHTLLIQDHLEEKFYIGVLFAVGSAVMLVVAVALLVARRPAAAWLTGTAVSLGMIVGFVLSRTIGLPYGYYEAGWEPPYGPLSLLAEALFVFVFIVRLGDRPAHTGTPARARRAR